MLLILFVDANNEFGNDIWAYSLTDLGWYWFGGYSNSSAANYVFFPLSLSVIATLPYPAARYFYEKILPLLTITRSNAAYAFDGSNIWFFGGQGIPYPQFSSTPYDMADLWIIQLGILIVTMHGNILILGFCRENSCCKHDCSISLEIRKSSFNR